MSIDTYADLKGALSDLLFHQRLVARYDLYCEMFEADANSLLRVRQMEQVIPLTTTAGDAGLPADYLVWRSIRPKFGTSMPVGPMFSPPFDELEYVHPAYLPPVGQGFNRLFTIETGKFKARPVDDRVGAYEMHYYAKIPSLIGAPTNTNWLLNEYPNAYLFGLMVEAMGTQRNSEQANFYKSRRDELFAEIVKVSSLTTGATSHVVRTAEYF